MRAGIVLLAAHGLSNTAIAAELATGKHTVGKWREGFARQRADGLLDEPCPGARLRGDERPGRGVRRGRNPRRPYNEEAREIAPHMVGAAQAAGETTTAVSCHSRRCTVIIATDRIPDDLPSPDLAIRVHCSACGSRDASVMTDMQAHYAGIHAEGG